MKETKTRLGEIETALTKIRERVAVEHHVKLLVSKHVPWLIEQTATLNNALLELADEYEILLESYGCGNRAIVERARCALRDRRATEAPPARWSPERQ